jgi:hypothetical protein
MLYLLYRFLPLLQLVNHAKENNQVKLKAPEQAILIKLMEHVIEQIVKQLKKIIKIKLDK